MEITSEAITLYSTLYKDRNCIVKLFTAKEGLITLIIHGLSKKRAMLFSVASPFTISLITYRKTKGEIYKFLDAKILFSNQAFRKNLHILKSASIMIKALITSQLPHKKSEKLYILSKNFLQKIPYIDNPQNICASFLVKLLTHDGLAKIDKICNRCPLPSSFIHTGESLCPKHSSQKTFEFSQEEMEKLHILAHAKDYASIEAMNLSEDMLEKLKIIFDNFYV